MQPRKGRHPEPKPKPKPRALKEMPAAASARPLRVNVRTAKDQLSSLLEQAARGCEVVITSDGIPKAKLVPFRSRRGVFRVDWEHLRSMAVHPAGPLSEALVREDRDGGA